MKNEEFRMQKGSEAGFQFVILNSSFCIGQRLTTNDEAKTRQHIE